MAEDNTDNNKSQSRLTVWYDADAYKSENEETRKLLEGTLGNVLVMCDETEYNRLLSRDHSLQRLVLIISGRLSRELLPRLHHATNILAIYIYCQNKKAYEGYVREYSKVNILPMTLLYFSLLIFI